MSSHKENSNSDLASFSYFVSHKGSVLVASLTGLCESDAFSILQQFKSELDARLGESVRGVVLNFTGVTGIANDLVPFWAQLQSMIRAREVELRLCGIEESLKEKLTKLGILRATETSNTLQEALPEIVVAAKRRAIASNKKSA